jgi:hypothetical protein
MLLTTWRDYRKHFKTDFDAERNITNFLITNLMKNFENGNFIINNNIIDTKINYLSSILKDIDKNPDYDNFRKLAIFIISDFSYNSLCQSQYLDTLPTKQLKINQQNIASIEHLENGNMFWNEELKNPVMDYKTYGTDSNKEKYIIELHDWNIKAKNTQNHNYLEEEILESSFRV